MAEAEQPPLRIVDAHQHFWDLGRNRHPWLQDEPLRPFRHGDYRALRRNYLPPDYRQDAAAFDIAATVHVEAEWDPADPVGEQRWLGGLRAAEGLPTVSVCQAWLDREDVADVLAAQARFPFVRGIRHKPRAAATPGEARRGEAGSMDDPRWRAGYALLAQRGFSFDLQTPFWHAEAARDLARDFPATPIIINHTFLPADRSAEGLAAWRRALELVAGEPNVSLKISGLAAGDNAPIVRDAIRIMGVERAMFASNYPVDRLVASFAAIFEGFRQAVEQFSEEEKRKLFHDNAMRLYKIGQIGQQNGPP
jgi:predicted TIM-barrel fold metal-dependent hydrolase